MDKELNHLDTFELMELLDRIHNWENQDLPLREEIQRRLRFAEDNGVTQE